MKRTSSLTMLAAVVASTTVLAGCGQAGQSGSGDGAGGTTELTMWTHSAGNEAELEVYEQIISDFNGSQDDYEVVMESFPQGAYNDAIVAGAAAGDLPCLLDMDGPIVPNWAWAGYIQPLGLPTRSSTGCCRPPSAATRTRSTPPGTGTPRCRSSRASRCSTATASGSPPSAEPWTIEEFDAALVTLQGAGYATPLDIGAEDAGEWWPYAYSPMLQSAGGDLVDRDSFLTADGALNGPEAVEFFDWFQSVFERGLASDSGTIGNAEFNSDEVGPQLHRRVERDGVPRHGRRRPADPAAAGLRRGSEDRWRVRGSGASPSRAADADGAREYLEFSFQPEYIAQFADNQVVIPATAEAEELSEMFGEGDPLRPFVELSQELAVERPPTPAYPVISSVFERAAKDIMSGAEVQSTLDDAVQEIDANIQSNDGYGF